MRLEASEAAGPHRGRAEKPGHRLEQQCGGGRVGTAGESRLSFTDFYTTFLLEKDKMIVLAFSYPI